MKKIILMSSSVFLVLALAGGLYFASQKPTLVAQPQTVSQKKDAPVQTKQQAETSNKTTENTPVSPTLSLNDVTATENGGYVSATAHILGNKYQSGSCVFTFENANARPVIRQANVISSANALACSSGNIPAVEFSVLGTWKLTVRYYYGGSQAFNAASIDIE